MRYSRGFLTQRSSNVGPILVVLQTAGLLGAADGFAQACRGTPTVDGHVDFRGGVGFAGETTRYGLDLGVNLAGPLSLGGGYTRIHFDERDIGSFLVGREDNEFHGEVSYGASGLALSVCPTAEVRYSWGSQEVLRRTENGLFLPLVLGRPSRLEIPAGVGMGKTLSAGSTISITLFVEPQVLFVLDRISFDSSGETDVGAEVGALVGAVLGSPRAYVRGDLSVTSREDAGPLYSLWVGVVF